MHQNKNIILSANIRAERSRKNYSQEELAEKANISVSSISLIERAKQTPSIYTVLAIARALDIDINELLRGL